MLASHLQKFRLRIIKKYGIPSTKQITNVMYVDEDNTLVKYICKQWQDANFKGYKRAQIVAMAYLK